MPTRRRGVSFAFGVPSLAFSILVSCGQTPATPTIVLGGGGGGSGGNEPAGMTQIFKMDGDTKDWGPQFAYGAKWVDRVSVVNDAAALNGKAVQVDWRVGDGAGFAGAAFWNDWSGTAGLKREVYIRVRFMYSPNWQQHPSGTTKIFYYGAGSIGGASQFYPQMNGNPGILRWRDQSGNGFDGVLAPTASGGIGLGTYHTLEIHHVANSAPGVSDGRLRMWLNGVEVTNWNLLGQGLPTDLRAGGYNWIGTGSHSLLKGLQLGTYWGGAGGRKLVNDYMRWAEIYISGKR